MVTQVEASAVVVLENVALAKKMANAYGWRDRQWRCLRELWMGESGFRHLAKNKQGSSAFGIAQMLRESSEQPAVQIIRGIRYIENRYRNDPCRALTFWKARGYY
jgi:hypothetical protein